MCDPALPSETLALIQTVAHNEGFKDLIIDKIEFNQKGEGFLGEICAIDIQDAATKNRLYLLVKAAFDNESIRKKMPIRLSYKNEVLFYSVIYPTFRQLTNLPAVVPKCYLTELKELAEALVFENLKQTGFRCFPKPNLMDDDHLRIVFNTYAIFHGCSFILKHQNEDEFNRLMALANPVWERVSESIDFTTAFKAICLDSLKFFDNETEKDVLEKFRVYAEGVEEITKECLTTKSDYDIITHGDCWSNNMMFLYKDNKPIDLRLIDFQLIMPASPTFDISYFFYTGASKQGLDKLDDYLEFYYKTLKEFTAKFNCNIEQYYPFEVLKKQWNFYGRLGLLLAVMLFKVKLTKSEDTIDMVDQADEQTEADGTPRWIQAKCDEETRKVWTRNLLFHWFERLEKTSK